MKGSVYSITNSITGKVYIGSTVQTLRSRISRHFSLARCGHGYNDLHRDIRKLGAQCFTVEALADNIPADQLNDIERQHIAAIPEAKRYNLKFPSKQHLFHTDITRKKLSRIGKRKKYGKHNCLSASYVQRHKLKKQFGSLNDNLPTTVILELMGAA
jgi:group I intron endonuclease